MARDQVSQLTREVRDALEEAMRVQHVSIRGLADLADVSPSTVVRLLNFERVPSTDTVDRLFRAMGLDPSFQFD
jgi:plasmid maintenance system antidote protein VapI